MNRAKFRYLIILAIGGCLLAWNGQREVRLSRESSREPRWVTCEALISEGIADNGNVRINGFGYNPDDVVFHHDDSQRYVETYIPIYAQRGSPGIVLLRSTSHRDPHAVRQLLAKNAVQGTVVNAVSSLDRDVRGLLGQLVAPGQDPLIVEVGRLPQTPASAMAMLLGGVLLSLPMVLAMPGRLQRRQRSTLAEEPPLARPTPGAAATAVESRPYF